MPPLVTLSWPYEICEAISCLLEDNDIPNVLWGDLANSLYGIDQVAISCGFVVPPDELTRATRIIEEAGLPSCSCTDMTHSAHPDSCSLPVHFPYYKQFFSRVYLCPSDMLMDIIPLTPVHPNRLQLEVKRVDPSPWFGERPRSRVLDAPSMFKAHMYLVIHATKKRAGLAFPWRISFYGYILRLEETGEVVKFGNTPHARVLEQYWADFHSKKKTMEECRVDALRRLAELES